jgi:HAD superfamily hydrolase (TIGR01484 family)
MVKQRIQTIISDYDGTLVPTANVNTPGTNSVASELEQILEKVSSDIPICIISTKDFQFLRNKTGFATVLSCMMGIETLVFRNYGSPRTIEKRFLHPDLQILQRKSEALEAIAEEIPSHKEFSHVLVECKHTSDGMLAGLTLDWRHQLGNDWSYYRRAINHFINRMVANLKKAPVPIDIYIQRYSEHPFVDIYSAECNKGIAFDTVLSELGLKSIDRKGTLYLGDSENDNPAFRKARISIGIRSDPRLNPKLDCSYFLDYKQLSSFLMMLRNKDYLFSDELLREAKKHEQA